MLNEFGGVAGFVTITDVLNFIFGQIAGRVAGEELHSETDQDAYEVPGDMKLANFNNLTNFGIEDMRMTTSGGVAFRHLDRLPVYEGNVSNVVGVFMMTTWDLLDRELGTCPLEDLVRPAHYVTRYETIDELLPVLKSRDDHMAIVVDEFGSAIGIITMEDIIEEIVGDIDVGYEFEEYLPRKQHRCRELDPEREAYEMDARLSISEVNDVLGLNLPTTEFHTVGGLLTARLRRLPKEGDSIVESGFCFQVVEATGRSITRIAVERDRPLATQQGRRRWPRIGKE